MLKQEVTTSKRYDEFLSHLLLFYGFNISNVKHAINTCAQEIFLFIYVLNIIEH